MYQYLTFSSKQNPSLRHSPSDEIRSRETISLEHQRKISKESHHSFEKGDCSLIEKKLKQAFLLANVKIWIGIKTFEKYVKIKSQFFLTN